MATFLITGGAGFIGSHVVAALAERGDAVRILDDFSTGRRENVAALPGDVTVLEGTILDRAALAAAMKGADFVIHLAAIPSVQRSIEAPWPTNRANVEGSINVFLTARDAHVRRVLFASSSSVYGNAARYPVDESMPCNPISPYGVSKLAVEHYARVFSTIYEMDIVGLRFFNVFGPRQDPRSAYSAAIPIFLSHLFAKRRPPVYGDGLQSRDFTFVSNIVEAHLRACEADKPIAGMYNIACGVTTTVLDMLTILNEALGTNFDPEFLPARSGEIKHSYANIDRAREVLGYDPKVSVRDGLRATADWFLENEGTA